MHSVNKQASCERKTENVCTVCDVMEMCVSTTAVLLYYAKTVLN